MESKPETILKDLMHNFPNQGEVIWIGVRPEKRHPLKTLQEVKVLDYSLEGDHYNGKINSTRHVTFIQQEHLEAVASFMAVEKLDPGLLRRNIVVRGINLLSLKDMHFSIGEAIFEMTGLCHPCSRMEKNLGTGGYNAMRGHGGITARIIRRGMIKLGDKLYPDQSQL